MDRYCIDNKCKDTVTLSKVKIAGRRADEGKQVEKKEFILYMLTMEDW